MSKYVVKFEDENIKVHQIIDALQCLNTPITITLVSDEAAKQSVQPTLLESEPIYNLHGEVVAIGKKIFDKTQSS